MKKIYSLALVLLMSFSTNAALPYQVETRTVEYKSGGMTFEGFVARPGGRFARKFPGVLVVHNWLGLTDQTKQKAREIAALGYVVFAADIFGKGVRPSREEAPKNSAPYYSDRRMFRDRIALGLEQLKKERGVHTKRLAALGYCFGGTAALELARSGADIQAAVSFHGGLDSPAPADAKNIKASLLVLHGADDPYVPDDKVAAFEKEMRDAKVDWQLIKYSGAVHSFTEKEAGNDNSKGAAYNALADRRSFSAMKSFLEEKLYDERF